MEILRAIARFILIEIVALCFLAAAPAIFVGVSLFVLMGKFGGNPGYLAFFYLAAGPLVSAVWTMIVLQVRNVSRTRNATGVSYKYNVRRHLTVWGYFAYGFFGTLVAEVAFWLLYHSGADPKVWFAVAPFVVFAPLVLFFTVGGGLKSAVRRYQYRKAQADYSRYSDTGTTKGMNSFEVWSAMREQDAYVATIPA